MSKLKCAGATRGVTPMGKTIPQNLPRTEDVTRQVRAFDVPKDKIYNLADAELRIVSVMHDEIIMGQKK